MEDFFTFFAGCPKNMNDLAAAEIEKLGGMDLKLQSAGVTFKGNLETAYRVLIWSRITGRLFLQKHFFTAENTDSIYTEAKRIPWNAEMDVTSTFAVSCDIINSKAAGNPNFAAQRVKDAVADQFREALGKRPDVNSSDPDISIHLLLKNDTAILSIELSNGSLHRRGYRQESGPAPLKENLAAAILIRAGWPEIAETGGAFIDPFCGTGTLPIEAALIAGSVAPALIRNWQGPVKWRGHDPELWKKLYSKAEEIRKENENRIPPVVGWDISREAVSSAIRNAEAAGMEKHIHIEKRPLSRFDTPSWKPGLIAANPPYGERIGEIEELVPLYTMIGKRLVTDFRGWSAAVLSGNESLSKAIGLKPEKVNKVLNGNIECSLVTFRIYSDSEREAIKTEIEKKANTLKPMTAGSEMFANRIRKNLRKLKKWTKSENVTCFRIYDADMPEYSAAVDLYENKWVNIQEYAPPKEIPAAKAAKHLEEIINGLKHVLEIPGRQIQVKTRSRQPGSNQYRKLDFKGEKHEIREGGHKFLINLSDYLDTGIFLDHRIIRGMIREAAEGTDFLNLFAYTGTASVYAAAGGARSTTTVDNSNTYLDWARENMGINGFTGGNHRFVKEDCFSWLNRDKGYYDLIFLDPPTFSNSKGSERTLDIQKDHIELILKSADRLKPGGTLIFSTNFRKFKFDSESLSGLEAEDISLNTIPPDFERNKKIHYCWKLKRK